MTDPKRNFVVIGALMEKAESDPMLRARLLTEPEKVAAEFNVIFDPTEAEYLRRVGDLYRMVDELKILHKGPGPVFYPADTWLNRKMIAQVLALPHGPVGYYIDIARLRNLALQDAVQKQTAPAVAAAAAQR